MRRMGASRPLRVLVADDDRDMVLTLTTILQQESHDARGVYRGDEVLPAMSGYEPDVVLLDIGMPGMSGYEVARMVRQQYGARRPMLIAITGWNKGTDKMIAELAGFNHHLGKPFAPQAVLDLIAPLTSSKQS